jgi:peptidoglycan/LPS O-acetylase OafA/YrhL
MGLTEIVYPMGLISAVAVSWGILLLVADRKPSQRKWVLISWCIALLSAVRIIFSLSDAIEFSLTFLSLGVLLILLLGHSHYVDSKSPAHGLMRLYDGIVCNPTALT